MGNKQSVSFGQCSSGKAKQEAYEYVRQLGEGRMLMKNKITKKQVTVIEHMFPSQQQLNEYIKRHKNSFSLTHQFYLNAYDYQVTATTNICSKQFKLAQYFEYQPHTLLDEINCRKETKKLFLKKQIMSILCSCVLALSYFNKNDILHYTLNPNDIIIDEDGVCKVMSNILSTNVFDFVEKKDFYYAPETLKMFKQQSLINGLTNKSGVFTLGVTLLHMIHLRNMSHLYSFSSYTVNSELISEEIKRIMDPQLQAIVKKMVKPQSYDRISFTELEQMLFQIIAKPEKSLKSSKDLFSDTQNYHISKLQQSIFRLKNEQTCQSSVSNNSQPQYCHFKKQNDNINLQRDEQDPPSLQYDHQLLTFEDLVVLDEFQHPVGPDQYLTTRNLTSSKSSKGMLGHQKITYSERTLSDCSHFYNNCVGGNINKFFRQNETFKENKENTISYFSKNKQNTERQFYPQYVSQVLNEGRYEGYKLGAFRHGFGTFYYSEGGKYCGQWVQNKMEGRGVLYYSSGKIAYEGQWKADRLNGYGVLYNQTIGVLDAEFNFNSLQLINDEWIKYEGYFKDDVKEDQGTLFLSNGQIYRGQFQNDQPHGKGQFKNIRGQFVRGIWLSGALNIAQ